MIRKGTRVIRRTKKVGQFAEAGKVTAIHDEHSFEVQWDDGHESIVSRDGITPLTEVNRPHKDD